MSRRIKFHDSMGLGNGWYVGAEDAGDGGVKTYIFREETRAERLRALFERARRRGARARVRDQLPASISSEEMRAAALRRAQPRRDQHSSRSAAWSTPRDESGPVELRKGQRTAVRQREDLVGSSLVRMAGSASDARQYRDLQEYNRRLADLWHPHTADAAERDFRKRLRASGMGDEEIEHTVAEWRQGRPGGPEGRERLTVRTNAGANAGERLRPYYGVPRSLAELNELNRTRDWGWGGR